MTETLPNDGEPLVLADGTVINPASGSVDKQRAEYTAIPSNTEVQRHLGAVQKRLSDLPAPPQQMNTISVVLTYTMLGLSDDDISLATGLMVEQIDMIKMLEAYSDLQDQVVDAIIAADSEDVRNIVQSGARHAARTMNTLMDSESEGIQMQAAKDVLDRAGHRPVDIVEYRGKLEGDLRIEVIERNPNDDPPIIDLEAVEITPDAESL